MEKQEVQNLIKELIEKTGVLVSSIDVVEEKNNNTLLAVVVSEPHLFISRDGEALYALNHIIRRIVEKLEPEKTFLIDINDFQKKKIDSVRAVAHMMSERARYFKANVEVDPMSAFERRIVHEFLSDATDLKTESVGIGGGRRVVIKYVGAI